MNLSIATGMAHQQEEGFPPQLMFLRVDQLSHFRIETLIEDFVLLHPVRQLFLESSFDEEVTGVRVLCIHSFHQRLLHLRIVAQKEGNMVGKSVCFVFLLQVADVHLSIEQILRGVLGKLSSHQPTNQIQSPVHFFLEILHIIIDHFQIRMVNPLLESSFIQTLGLVQTFKSGRVGVETVMLLCSSSCRHHVDHHVVPLIADVVPSPLLILENFAGDFRLDIGEVVTNTSVVENDHVFFMYLGQSDVEVLQVYLSLTESSGNHLVFFVIVFVVHNVDTSFHGESGHFLDSEDGKLRFEEAFDLGEGSGLSRTGASSQDDSVYFVLAFHL